MCSRHGRVVAKSAADPGAQVCPHPRSAMIVHLTEGELHKLSLPDFPHRQQNGFQSRTRVSLRGAENVLKLDSAVVAQHCRYTKCH